MTSATFKYRDGKIYDPSGQIQIGVSSAAAGDVLSPIILKQTAVAVSITGTTDETTLASITVPAGLMGGSGSIRITSLWSHTVSANLKTLRASFGGTNFLTLSSSATIAAWQSFVMIRNRTAATQAAFPAAGGNSGLGAATVAISTGAVNTAVDQVILLTAQLASAGETITLEGYTVEIIPGG